MSAYIDADVEAARAALIEHCVSHYPDNESVRAFAESMFGDSDPTVITVLNAVAPAIAARALREAAHNPAARLSGHSGVSVRWLAKRADEIERA